MLASLCLVWPDLGLFMQTRGGTLAIFIYMYVRVILDELCNIHVVWGLGIVFMNCIRNVSLGAPKGYSVNW